MRYVLIFCGFGLWAGCVPNLSPPSSSVVACDVNDDCSEGFGCRAGRCVDLNENQAPSLNLDPITRGLESIAVPLRVIDFEADKVNILVEIQTDAASGFHTLDVASAKNLSTSAEGSAHILEIEDAVSLLLGLGLRGYVAELRLRLTPVDAESAGAAVVTSAFEFGNDAPVVSAIALPDVVDGNTVVRFSVSDLAGDTVSLSAFEYSATGAADGYVAIDDFSVGAGFDFSGGILEGLATSPSGVAHNFTWDSALSIPGDRLSARVRLRVEDSFGAETEFMSSDIFRVDNGETPPSFLSFTPDFDIGALVTGSVSVTYAPEDQDGDSSTLVAQFSIDGGANYNIAQSNSPTVELQSGSTQVFVWNTAQLEPALYDDVVLRMTVYDGAKGEERVVGPFQIDTRNSLNTDDSPPNYISPANGTVFLDETVLLQWTPRLGASTYTVEVSTSDDFLSHALESPYSVESTELLLGIPSDESFFWRVRADVTVAGEFSSLGGTPSEFHRLGETLYVYCAHDDVGGCGEAGQVGNRSRPYRGLSTAIAAAANTGINTVWVAGRGNDAGYAGIVILANGVSVYGGYAPDFDEASRGTGGNETILTGGGSLVYGSTAVVAEGISTPTVFDGFEIRVPASDFAHGLRIGPGVGFSFSNSVVVGALGVSSTGLRCQLGQASVEDVEMFLSPTPSTSSVGYLSQEGCILNVEGGQIQSSNASPENAFAPRLIHVEDARLESNGAVMNRGVSMAPGDVSAIVLTDGGELELNNAELITAACSQRAIGVENREGTLTISDSMISMPQNCTSGGSRYGVSNAGTLLLERSTVSVGGDTFTVKAGVWLEEEGPAAGRQATVQDSTILLSGASDVSTGTLIGVGSTSGGASGVGGVGITNSSVELGGAGTLAGLLLQRPTEVIVQRSTVITGDAGAGFGRNDGIFVSSLQEGASIQNSVIQVGRATGSIAQSVGISATLSSAFVTIRNNAVRVSSSGGNASGIIATNADVSSNTILVDAATLGMSAQGILLESTNPGGNAVENNLLIMDSGTTRRAISLGAMGTGQFSRLSDNGIVDGGAGDLLTDYDMVNPAVIYDSVCGGGFAIGPCPGTPFSSPVATGSILSTRAAFFGAEFDEGDPLKWDILGFGPADLDSSGGFSTGDIGCEVGSIGAP